MAKSALITGCSTGGIGHATAAMVVTALKSLTFEQLEQAMRQQLGLTW